MTITHRLSAVAALMITALTSWNALAESTNSNESAAKIAPGTATSPHNAAGNVSSQSADAMHPSAHEGEGKRRGERADRGRKRD